MIDRTLTKNERRYLRGFECKLCDMPLSNDDCGSIYGPPCSQETRAARREKCLSEYKPRVRLLPAGPDGGDA